MELSAELLKGSARVKRSGSSRDISGDFSPSISFYVSEPEEEDGERSVTTDGETDTRGNEGGFGIQMKKEQKNFRDMKL